MKQVKITYQGGGKAGYTACITDAETGELISGFISVDVHIDCNSIPVATFTVHAPYLDITALAAIAAPAVVVTEVPE